MPSTCGRSWRWRRSPSWSAPRRARTSPPPGGMEHFLIPSYDLHGRGFDRRRYWRGPVWINTDWLVWRGLRQHGETALAGEVEDSMVGLVRCSGFREYYDPFGAQGYGSDDFSWTAALLLDVLGNRAGGLSSSA